MGSLIRGSMAKRSYLRPVVGARAKTNEELQRAMHPETGACSVQESLKDMRETMERSKAMYAAQEAIDHLILDTVVPGPPRYSPHHPPGTQSPMNSPNYGTQSSDQSPRFSFTMTHPYDSNRPLELKDDLMINVDQFSTDDQYPTLEDRYKWQERGETSPTWSMSFPYNTKPFADKPLKDRRLHQKQGVPSQYSFLRFPYFRHSFDDPTLMDSALRQKAVLDNLHINTLNDLIHRIQILHGDVEILTNTCTMLIADRLQNNKDLHDMVRLVESLAEAKADKDAMHDLLDKKANVHEVVEKLSHIDFVHAMEELSKGMEKAVSEICRQEILFQDAVDILLWEVGRKLNRYELAPLKEILNVNLKTLHRRLKRLEKLRKRAIASATARSLKSHDTCVACDTHALLKKCKYGPLPVPPNFIPHRNLKPFLNYQLDRLRKNPKRKRLCIRYCGGSHTIMYKRGTSPGRILVKDPCQPFWVDTKRTPKRRKSQESSKSSSILTGFFSKILMDKLDDSLEKKGTSYADAPKGSLAKIPKKLATQLYIVDPDLSSSDSDKLPGIESTREKLNKINSHLSDYSKLPVKIASEKSSDNKNLACTVEEPVHTEVHKNVRPKISPRKTKFSINDSHGDSKDSENSASKVSEQPSHLSVAIPRKLSEAQETGKRNTVLAQEPLSLRTSRYSKDTTQNDPSRKKHSSSARSNAVFTDPKVKKMGSKLSGHKSVQRRSGTVW